MSFTHRFTFVAEVLPQMPFCTHKLFGCLVAEIYTGNLMGPIVVIGIYWVLVVSGLCWT